MIKGIVSILSLLWILLAGNPQPKHDLRRKNSKEDFSRNLNCWIQKNRDIIVIAAMTTLLIVFVFVMFWLCGISAVESGTMRNFINGGVI